MRPLLKCVKIATWWRSTTCRRLVTVALVVVLAPAACYAIAGIEGTFEYSFDAPWRIEPSTRADGGVEFGPVPIQLAIHDADLDRYVATDSLLTDDHIPVGPTIFVNTNLGRVCRITVGTDYGNGFVYSNYSFADLAEVEATTGRWPAPGQAPSPSFRHDICRAWKGEDCSPWQHPAFYSEWHATLWHELRAQDAIPGNDVVLTVRVDVTKPGIEDCASAARDDLIQLISDDRVHLGEAPLPRFDSRWLYGDLHYHSQGTDNEGESGHSYRGVVRAMGSMGLDFLFATDHASNSTQIIDSDLRHLFIRLSPPAFEFDGIEVGDTLRDMSPERFTFSHGLLHAPDGVNAEAAVTTVSQRPPQDFLSHGVFPQIFLGGEVDTIPEIPEPILQDVPVPFGNELGFYPIDLCGGQPADKAVRELNANVASRYVASWFDVVDWFTAEPTLSDLQCGLDDIYETTPTGTLLRDFQGVEAFDYGRLHLIYLPRDGADPNAFVASDTGQYGGAGRRLADEHEGRPALLPELESHGFFFAAHPLSGLRNRGGSGPDGMPWSDFLLDKAFRSPAFLGLQFWNEDTRLVDRVAQWGVERETLDADAPRPPGGACSAAFVAGGSMVKKCSMPSFFGGPGYENGSAHQYGYERLDVIEPYLFVYRGFSAKPFHVPNDRPRAGFETGLFHLSAPGIRTGLWESAALADERMHEPKTVGFMLHHGAFTWDRLIHWGMDASRTKGLEWLSEVEPRRVFMAGGSDAHGDLNHREEGYFLGATAITDTAIGKPRNLVEMQTAGSSHSQTDVVDAIAAGRFAITDGPAFRIAIDVNGNGIIDPEDVPMGSVFELRGRSTVPLLIEWLSTSEFGGVRDIDLYVGARSTAGDLAPGSTNQDFRPESGPPHLTGRTYAPLSAGPYSVAVKGGLDPLHPDSPIMVDNYWKDPTADANGVGGVLRILPRDGALSGVAAVNLNLDDFPASCCAADECHTCPADRHYVRAFAETVVRDAPGCMSASEGVDLAYRRGDCIRRYAYTNPIWIQDTSFLCSAAAGVDSRPPSIACNTPDAIAPNDVGISFEATATDGCNTTLAITDFDCFSFNRAGKRVDRTGTCELGFEDGRVTVLDSGGVGDHITWTVVASDEAGNESTQQCEVVVKRPQRRRHHRRRRGARADRR